MNVKVKKILIRVLAFVVVLMLFVGLIFILFSKDIDYVKKNHGSVKVFSADINYDGIIDKD